MIYLSRLILNTRNPQVRRDLGDCHQLHRTVLRAFPQSPDGIQARKHFGLLYRAEAFARDPLLARMLVQSAVAPDWSQLPAGYLAPLSDVRGNPAVRLVDDEYAQIQAGMQLIFRLRANPTKRISDRTAGRENKLLGKRVALLREEDQLAWLERKGQSHGFRLLATAVQPELPDIRVTALEQTRGRRPVRGDDSSLPLSFGAALFEGCIEVTDRTAFLATLRAGLGSGKAFGFGLLSVAARQ